MKILSGIVAGLLLWPLVHFVGNMIVLPHLTGRTDAPGWAMGISALAFFASLALGLFFASRSATAAKVWRKMLIVTALFFFALPLASVIMAAGAASSGPNAGSPGHTAGALIGGGILAGAFGFLGFFAGGICLVIGLLVGRDPKIVYVSAPAPAPPATPEK